MSFHSIKPAELQENLFDLIGKDWFLMSAEKDGRVNPMTVAWATMGILWQKPVVICAVRPERFTREFLDASDVFSLTVFENSGARCWDTAALCLAVRKTRWPRRV